MTDERVLWEAEFNPRVTTYWLLNGAIILTATIVGIVRKAVEKAMPNQRG